MNIIKMQHKTETYYVLKKYRDYEGGLVKEIRKKISRMNGKGTLYLIEKGQGYFYYTNKENFFRVGPGLSMILAETVRC